MFTSPAWLGWSLAGLFVVLAVLSLTRVLRADCPCADGVTGGRASAIAHAVMAVAMAVMCTPWVGRVPGPVWWVVFVGMASWFTATLVRAGGDAARWRSAAAHHLLGAVAMLAMVSAMGGPSATGGEHAAHAAHSAAPGGLLLPAVVAALVVYFVADAAMAGWAAVRGGPAGRTPGTARAVMAAGMVAMLVPVL